MRDIISKPVLVSGSSVGPLEVNYAADAAQTGWNEKCFDYLKRQSVKFWALNMRSRRPPVLRRCILPC